MMPAPVFATYAGMYAEQGLAVFPTGGEDGKRPAIKGWPRVGLGALPDLVRKFPAANIGIPDGRPGGITRVDIDDPALVDDCIARFGDTPIKVETPSGGLHLWYAANGERRRLRLDGMKVDILGRGGHGLAPPSVNPQKGAYRFLEGSPADISRLPRMADQSVARDQSAPAERIGEGRRNDELFRFCMKRAPGCDSLDSLLDAARSYSETAFRPALPDAEVVRVARSAWGYTEAGTNRYGRGRVVQFGHDEVDNLLMADPDAFMLLTLLKRHHWNCRRPFVIANAMAERMPGGRWPRKRFAAARQRLEAQGEIEMIRAASRAAGPAQYRFKGGRI